MLFPIWLARLLGEARISDLANRLSSASAVVKTRLPGLPSLSAERLHPTALLLIQIVDYTRRCKRFLFDLVNTRLLRFLSLFAVFAAILFVVFPSIDLGVARWFFQPPHSFQLGETWIGRFFDGDVHFGMEWFLALLVGTFLYGQIKRRNYFGLTRKRFLFIALSIGLGAGLLTNVVLKDTWGRARPSQVTEFGGTKQFTPPFVRSTQCDRNCSFVSGDASLAAGFLTFAMIADRHRRRWWIGLGGFAALVGVMRMARGSHFLSDVVFGVLFTLMISLILKRLIIEDRWRAWPRLRRDSRLDDSERSKPA